ncbi:MAG: CBS and ACT domain-containing protein [Solobacterium sp.]|jgi:acetoin utilization protein AcuB|nr:CBS and ACT domain-containing protein [Solobacterium sp.]MCH4222623.1 CBS and ACT domain-containing protein [Solobacterium sp.]MCH4266258.1 CBS and ACT domain-containing protein [Solobacterium sp.]
MYVKDYMTVKPTCISGDTTVSKALDLMSQNGFHRLPVVDASGTLKGLITEGLVSDTSGAKSTSLTIYELNYLLSRTKAADIMIKDVKTIGPNELLEAAASKMRSENISVLPVVDTENKIIGIITENDIFEAFIELLGYRQEGTRFVIHIGTDKVGVLGQIADLFGKDGISLSKMSVDNSRERGIEIMILANADCPDFAKKLEAAGFELTEVKKLPEEVK